MSDDHAAHAIGAYGSVINETPQMDRIANEGMRLDNCFCTNSICAPSRAAIITGKYSHLNGVFDLNDDLDGRQMTFPKLLQADGYQTAMVGKWHLGHQGINYPTGFDYWEILPGQGLYHDPVMHRMGEVVQHEGYVTDLITDFSLNWLEARDRNRPFCMLTHHKAPHRRWEPDDKHVHMYDDVDIPEPASFHDDHSGHGAAAHYAKMSIDRDLTPADLKHREPPTGLSPVELKSWKYQCYIKDYLRVIVSVDDNIGRMLDYLDEEGLTENTIVIYTSDQGFFLGDHGWYDKRFMYEESLQMPFLARYPEEIEAGSVNEDIVLNVDFGPTLLDYAGLQTPRQMQGASFRENLRGNSPQDWRSSFYYRYFMHCAGGHDVYAHYGVRTDRYKLIYYYEDQPGPRYWELFDLEADPLELQSVYDDPAYAGTVAELKEELLRLRSEVGDQTNPWLD